MSKCIFLEKKIQPPHQIARALRIEQSDDFSFICFIAQPPLDINHLRGKEIITLSIVLCVYDLIRKWQFEVSKVVFLGKQLINNCTIPS